MYHILHTALIDLMLYHNDWGKLDFIRRLIVTGIESIIDYTK